MNSPKIFTATGAVLVLAMVFGVTISLLAAPTLPAPTVALDPKLKPSQSKIAAVIRDGPARSVAAITDKAANKADFVENEILLFSNDSVTANKLASRWKGQVLASVDFAKGRLKKVPSMYLIHITSSLASPATLSRDLAAVNKERTGALRVSSKNGLLTLAAAAKENASGLQVGLNFVLKPQSIHNRSTTEGAGPFIETFDVIDWQNDAFHWPYMMSGGTQDIGVGEAWRALEAADRFKNKVDVLIVDSGFDPNADFPPNSVQPVGTAGVPGPGNCSGIPCPFHGTDVTLGGFAVPDNNFGAAGPGGPVANLTLVSVPSPDIFQFLRFLDSLISSLIRGPRIINISSSSRIPAVACLGVCAPLDLIGVGFRALNILTFAAPENDGMDVDRKDCIGVACWESGETIPCEI